MPNGTDSIDIVGSQKRDSGSWWWQWQWWWLCYCWWSCWWYQDGVRMMMTMMTLTKMMRMTMMMTMMISGWWIHLQTVRTGLNLEGGKQTKAAVSADWLLSATSPWFQLHQKCFLSAEFQNNSTDWLLGATSPWFQLHQKCFIAADFQKSFYWLALECKFTMVSTATKMFHICWLSSAEFYTSFVYV